MAYLREYAREGKYNNIDELLYNSLEDCLKFSEEQGFKTCELILDPPGIFADEKKQRLLDLCNSYSPEIQIHGPFIDLSLNSYNNKIAQASVDSYIEIAKLCEEIGSKILTIHPGNSNSLIGSLNGFNTRRLIKSVNELLDATAHLDLTICIENMPKLTGFFLRVSEIEEFFTLINRKDLFMTYDTSHLWTNNGAVDELWNKFSKLIKNIHLVDNSHKMSDGHPRIGSGKVNFQKIFEIIKKYEYKDSLIIEISMAKTLTESIEYVKKFI